MPSRLGTDFRWLLSAALINNLGDGITLAAGPLLVASLTQDPFLVSLARDVRLPAGFDLRGHRRGRGGPLPPPAPGHRREPVAHGVLLAMVATIVTGTVSIAFVLAAIFALGTAETFADGASSTMLPSLVRREDLGVANARTQSAFILLNQLLGPPIGAFLFVIGMALPFAANAAAFLLGAVLIARIATPAVARVRRDLEQASVWSDLVEGVRWLPATRQCGRWRSRSLRSTSRTARRGACSFSTPPSGWACPRSGSGC